MNSTIASPRRTHRQGSDRRGLRTLRRAIVTIAVALAVLALPISVASASDGRLLSVATWGSDSAAGSMSAPYRTLTHAMSRLQPGDTLIVRGGTYDERVLLSGSATTPAHAGAPITVRAAEGEQPVIRGRLKLSGADHWTISGIDVTWSSANSNKEHMVQFWGGHNWRFTDAEVWGARSFSAINVDNGATDFRLDHLYVHDTHATNGVNQDHLIYIARNNQNGIIERNVLAGSPNGRGVKIGPGSITEPSSDGIVIRHNTFHDNQGPSNVRFSGDSTNNQVYGNILSRSGPSQAAVTGHLLSGDGNVARNNLAWAANGVVENIGGLVDGGGNNMADPGFVNPAAGDFRTTNPAAAGYGAHAATTTTTPTTTTPTTTTPTTTTPTTTTPTTTTPTTTTPTTTTERRSESKGTKCPKSHVLDAPFDDVDPAGVHAHAIDCVHRMGVTEGTAPNRFEPARAVTRGQMASFIARTLEQTGAALDSEPPDAFGDDDASTHAHRIDQLAAVGVVDGQTDGTYRPDQPITRAQMATFLARAARVTGIDLPAGPNAFADDDDLVHAPSVDAMAHAGVVLGRADGTYGPHSAVTREQMGSFLARFLDLFVAEETTSVSG